MIGIESMWIYSQGKFTKWTPHRAMEWTFSDSLLHGFIPKTISFSLSWCNFKQQKIIAVAAEISVFFTLTLHIILHLDIIWHVRCIHSKLFYLIEGIHLLYRIQYFKAINWNGIETTSARKYNFRAGKPK